MAKKKKKGKKKAEKGNLYAVIAYVLGFIGALIVIFTQKKDKFALFHAKQSLLLSIVVVVIGFVLGVIPILGWILAVTIYPIGTLLVFLWGAYKAYTGEWYRFPMIADYAENLNL